MCAGQRPSWGGERTACQLWGRACDQLPLPIKPRGKSSQIAGRTLRAAGCGAYVPKLHLWRENEAGGGGWSIIIRALGL